MTTVEAPVFLPPTPPITPTLMPLPTAPLPVAPPMPTAAHFHFTTEYIDAEKAQALLDRSPLRPKREHRRKSTSAGPADNRPASRASRQANKRPLSNSRIVQWAADMAAGRWLLTPEPICLSPAPAYDIIDGQTRLLSVIEAYKLNPAMAPVPFTFAWNVTPELFTVINTGRSRSTGDLFAIDGAANYTAEAAAARLVYFYYASNPDTAHLFLGPSDKLAPASAVNWTSIPVAPQRLLEVRRVFPMLDYQAGHADTTTKRTGLAVGALIAARFLINQACAGGAFTDESQARPEVEEYFEQLSSGTNLDSGHPAYELREWAIRGRNTVGKSGMMRRSKAVAKGPLHLRLLIQSWNHIVEGRSIKSIAFKVDGKVPKPLPLP